MTKQEAMNLVKQVLPCLNIDKKIREAFETLIPELRENDDDKVRKEIIEYLKCVGKGDGDYAQPMIDRWISYLEKEEPAKEVIPVNGQKYYACHEFDREFENQVSHLIASVLNGEYPYTRGFVKWVAQSLFGYAKAELEQAGSKRNPDENQLIGFIYDLLESLYWKKDWAMSKEECLNGLSRLVPHLMKKWSEEDEICIGYLADFVDKNGDDFYGKNKKNVVKFIRSLLDNDLIVEWSSEDDERLEDIDNMLWKLDSYIGDDCSIPQEKADSMRGEIQNVLCPWLKSIHKKLKMK